ncbi:MAG: uroporphyrinogen-III synthase [Pseudomonadota bacterium]
MAATGSSISDAAGPGTGRGTGVVLVVRPEPGAAASVAALEARGLPALACPPSVIRPSDPAPAVPGGTEALVFTSAAAVRAMAAAPRLAAYCVGGATAEAARAAGFRPVVEGGGTAAALAACLARAPERRFFHPHGADVAADMAALMADEGAGERHLAGAVAYAAVAAPALPAAVAAALAGGQARVAGAWSARGAALFVGLVREAGLGAALDRLVGVAISPAAAVPLVAAGLADVRIAAAPESVAMMDALAAGWRDVP